MTESLPLAPSYEQVRDSTPDADVRVPWREADSWKGFVRERYQTIDSDEDLTPEAKERAREKVYEDFLPRVAAGYDKARHLADNFYDASIPVSGGRSMATSSITGPAELSAVQSEETLILANISSGSINDKIRENTGKKGRIKEASDPRRSKLQALYAEAIQTPGIEGKTRCHAILRAAQRLGMDPEIVVAEVRDERHTDYLNRARQWDQIASTIPSAESVTPRPTTARRPAGHMGTRRPATTIASGRSGGALFPQKPRRRSWK